MEQFSGRTAVVTGAGSGMGKAFALRLAAEGMRVVAADIQDDALQATVAQLKDAGTDAIGVHTDVSDADAVHALAKEADERFGPVHVLCNNAGVEGYLDGAIWEATDRDWAWTFNVNFWSVVHGIRAFVPAMISHGEGAHVVNTASMTSVIAASNMYGITKHAVLALSEVLASDLRKRNAPVGVTAICPGTIATNLFHGSRNRPTALRNEAPTPGADEGAQLRERMHAVLSEGMAPAEVADKVVDAIRRNAQYLLTDRDWNPQIIQRHEALLAAAVDRVASS
jgi:NAD(P)-dependent dehydrogenase (short-subunit alcohol dehydrogenase family)